MAYKKDVSDTRESPALDIIHLLRELGASISYTDPYVPLLRVDHEQYESKPLETELEKADCVVIVTDHSCIDYARIIEKAKLIVDTRNALKGYRDARIVKL